MSQELNLIEKTLETFEKQLAFGEQIKRIIEALLFSSSEPLSLDKLKEIIGTSYSIRKRELQRFIEELALEYQQQQRAIQIDQIAGGYLLRTCAAMRPFVEQLHQDRRGDKLSQAATEVLAVTAFKSPITRREIEKIRGVDCSGVLSSLIERGLIEIIGKKDTPGKPVQYGVTKKFLQHFGIKDVSELTHAV